MFAAARAAMIAATPAFDPATARTHSGFIAAFGQELVRTGRVPIALGRLLNRAHEVRLVADYRGEAVSPADAAEITEQARHFVDAMRELVGSIAKDATPGTRAP